MFTPRPRCVTPDTAPFRAAPFLRTMIARSFLFLTLILLSGCRQQSSDPRQTLGGSTADSEVTGSGERLGAAGGGVEHEAPRLIPGMLAILGMVTDSAGRLSEGTLTGYKQAAGRLVDAMLTDLNRVGVGDDGSFRALGDSVVNALGGGTGVPDADAEAVRRSAEMMRRLIGTYNQRMRSVKT